MRPSLTLAVLLSFALTPQPPQFRSGVQLLTIETTVRDKGGNPVMDLKPSDFTVTIDGKPRAVVFAHFFHAEPATIVGSGDTTVGRYVSNVDSPATGHALVFAIDRDALPPGTERPILESAAAILDRLSPADSVGLVEIPGRSFEVTRDRTRIADVLRSIVGSPPHRTSARHVTWEESKAFDRQNRRVMQEVYARECEHDDAERCVLEVNVAARETLSYGRQHAQVLLRALTSVVSQLGVMRAPKHLVLLSAGLPFDPEFVDEFKAFQRAAAEARVTVETIRVHEFTGDAASDVLSSAGFEDPGTVAGMDTLATMTGGRAFAPAGTAAGVFTRIVSDVTTFYELGVESVATDANGKLHDVTVHVNRANLETVARPVVAAPALPPAGALLDSALRQPVDVGGVPIAISAYSTFGASGVHRVVVAAEIGGPGSPAPAEWGVVVIRDGKSVASTRGRIPARPQRPQIVTTTMELAEGSYRLRVGAVDAEDGAGTLEIPLTVGALTTSSGARIGDLMIGIASGRELEPRSRVSGGDEITAVLRMTGPAGTEPAGTVQFVRGGGTTAAATAPLAAMAAANGTFTLQATIDPGVLPPGRYTALATLRSGDQVLGRVSRVLEVVPAAAPVSPAAGSATPASAAEPLTSDAPAADVMKHVASYVEQYGEAASVLVGVERYAQRADEIQSRPGSFGRSAARPTPMHTTARTLTSELALVRNTAAIGGWLAFRDVVQVDGKPVSDRGDRLRALFEREAPDLDAARKISDESTRFNVGPIRRTFNVPTAALFFFTPGNLRRFAFKNKGTEQIDGGEARAIDFHETAKPTLIMNGAGKDVPCSGTVWVDPADGHVLKTLLTLTGYAGPGSTASVEVSYRHHTEFDMWVPAMMRESYVTSAGSVAADAEYVDFRRFQTSAKIKK